MDYGRSYERSGSDTASRTEFELRALEAPVSDTQPLLSRGLSYQEQISAQGLDTYTPRAPVSINGRDTRAGSQAVGDVNEAAVEQPLLTHGAAELRAVRSPDALIDSGQVSIARAPRVLVPEGESGQFEGKATTPH
ncbi:hypothetical protein LTR91_025743 [Friedmanniomyces endolithicus]|uniref:Uncharacterized protein n=1 Tax=Friedmanniomyces endolithicus TaxID=329885 RepID=A0AAN6H4F9_9PEZI|nr:hypothetical protein LTS09_003814 [Friedmanniomyces endolithicus]KAK0271492.1 hypothetical protein LTR35_013530 [Friedmanniomyces endolithicus]KAK0297198.1 hypothetical protein LTS00_004477 [Friedmanniomyces endolithicus]KAK0315719.1 hypothetical protein LTR01_001019 [Friedmanniomyces endolithicus]KAK0320597.1 hypothetical protein LTR82_008310 [Friedmanniomyces endolithicus]